MVAFCCKCNHSLPFADVHIIDGEEQPLAEYECPHCGEQAGEEKAVSHDVEGDEHIVIKNGEES